MLSESVLSELLLDTPLRESLITLAWPSLDTAGRLQVIQAIYEQDTVSPSCPTWLATLAMKDSEPIVRYWAAKRTYFRSTRPPNEPEWNRTTDEELYLFAEAASDTSEFIRFFATKKIHEISGYDLTPLSQQGRLLSIRNLETANLEEFVDWIADAVEANVPERELIDCCREYFKNPRVKAHLARKTEYLDDEGFTWHSDGKAMDKGWFLVKTAPTQVARHLAAHLPTRIATRSKSLGASDLTGLNRAALEVLLWRESESREIAELCNKVRERPSDFPEDAVAALQKLDSHEYGRQAAEDSKEDELNRAATERNRAIHKDIIELKQQVAEMREMLQDLGSAQSRKRGLFG